VSAAVRRGALRRLLAPGLSTLVMLALLIGLGVWQLRRLHWKLGILAQIAHAETMPAIPLPPDPSQFTKVAITGILQNRSAALVGAEGRDTAQGPQMGGQLVVPMLRAGKTPVLVDRGWIPSDMLGHVPGPSGPITVDGYVRAGDRPGLFSATDDPAHRLFYTLDPQAIGRALDLPHLAAFTLIALGPQPPAGFPDPAKSLPRPPNNHLTYAMTWFGLAGALVVIFAQFAYGQLREPA
jgi:surfeit locus 1 family protein